MNQLTTPWKNLRTMTRRRDVCVAATLGGKLFVTGGSSGDVMDTIESYDFGEGRWTQAPARMSQQRLHCAAAAIGGSICVTGGYDDFRGDALDSVEAFDVDSGLWRTLPSMSNKRFGCAAVAVGDEFIVFGGTDDDGDSFQHMNTAESFNIKRGRWEDLPSMINRRCFCATTVIKNKVYVIGGEDIPRSVLDTVEVFDLSTRTWTLLPHRMTTGRSGCAAAAVGNHLVVAGGNDHEASNLKSVEMYNVDTERWTELPPISTERWGCAAVSLGGSVFVMGGQDKDGSELDSVEELQFSEDIVKGMLVGWSEGSWRDEVAPILHKRTSLVHSIGVNVPLMPTLLSNIAKEERVQTIFRIIRGEMSIFEHTTG